MGIHAYFNAGYRWKSGLCAWCWYQELALQLQVTNKPSHVGDVTHRPPGPVHLLP